MSRTSHGHSSTPSAAAIIPPARNETARGKALAIELAGPTTLAAMLVDRVATARVNMAMKASSGLSLSFERRTTSSTGFQIASP